MNRKIYHMTPADDGWRVKREGAGRAASVEARKADAVDRARELAASGRLGQVKVHGRDGAIHAEFTYGKDPRRTRG